MRKTPNSLLSVIHINYYSCVKFATRANKRILSLLIAGSCTETDRLFFYFTFNTNFSIRQRTHAISGRFSTRVNTVFEEVL